METFEDKPKPGVREVLAEAGFIPKNDEERLHRGAVHLQAAAREVYLATQQLTAIHPMASGLPISIELTKLGLRLHELTKDIVKVRI